MVIGGAGMAKQRGQIGVMVQVLDQHLEGQRLKLIKRKIRVKTRRKTKATRKVKKL